MSYEFWSLFWGWLAIAAFVIPVGAAILIQVVVFLVAMLGSFLGFGSQSTGTSRVSMRVTAHDMDTDY
jgi:hypothetical protein